MATTATLTINVTEFAAISSGGYCDKHDLTLTLAGDSKASVPKGTNLIKIGGKGEVMISVNSSDPLAKNLAIIGLALVGTGDFDSDGSLNFENLSWTSKTLTFDTKFKHKSGNGNKATWKLLITVANLTKDPTNLDATVVGVIDPDVENTDTKDDDGSPARRPPGASRPGRQS
jgi:hypothetical protein